MSASLPLRTPSRNAPLSRWPPPRRLSSASPLRQSDEAQLSRWSGASRDATWARIVAGIEKLMHDPEVLRDVPRGRPDHRRVLCAPGIMPSNRKSITREIQGLRIPTRIECRRHSGAARRPPRRIKRRVPLSVPWCRSRRSVWVVTEFESEQQLGRPVLTIRGPHRNQRERPRNGHKSPPSTNHAAHECAAGNVRTESTFIG
jgi:hypothetical protein